MSLPAKTARNDALYADREAGRSWAQLAARYGVNRASAKRIYLATRRRVVFGYRPMTPEDLAHFGRLGGQRLWARLTPEQRARRIEQCRAAGRIAGAKHALRIARMTPEERRADTERRVRGMQQWHAAQRFKRRQAAKTARAS